MHQMDVLRVIFKCIWLTQFIFVFGVVCQLDSCPADDLRCKYPNLWKTGKIIYGSCQQDNILRRLQSFSVIDCVIECFITSMCVGFNYRRGWQMCDLAGVNGTTLVKETGCFYSSISSWSKTLAGKCADHECHAGEKCRIRSTGGISCQRSYCKDIPDVKNATCTEYFGLHRDLGQGNRFECNTDLEKVGRPFYVCQKNGSWKKLFCCRLPCFEGWKRYDGNCYYFGQERLTWESAQDTCKANDSNLVNIANENENNWIGRSITEVTWIGAKATENRKWKWVSDGTQLQFTQWNGNEPNNQNDEEDCVEIKSIQDKYAWNDRDCTIPHHYVCKKEPICS